MPLTFRQFKVRQSIYAKVRHHRKVLSEKKGEAVTFNDTIKDLLENYNGK